MVTLLASLRLHADLTGRGQFIIGSNLKLAETNVITATNLHLE